MKKKELDNKIENLPNLPGVYLFKNSIGKIIYIGKAKNLRNRVKSYFVSHLNSAKTEALVNKIADLDVIVTDNEVEALILESNLIKQHKPRYNINLKDDKSYPYITITNEDYPQVYATRKVVRDGSKYFGPYTDVKTMKYALRVLREVFRIRSCRYNITQETIEKKKYKVCLDYHIKKCDGPCEGLILKEDYNKMIDEVELVLRGKIDPLISSLYQEMLKYSEELKFEKAAEIKRKIDSLQVYSNSQKVVGSDLADRDIITCSVDIPDGVAAIFNIRNGKLVGKKKFHFAYNIELPSEDIYSNLIRTIYDSLIEIPPEIIVPTLPLEKEDLQIWLSKKCNYEVKIFKPSKDDIQSLVNLCNQNAIFELNEIKLQRMKKEGEISYILRSLQRDLNLPHPPIRIECFDISTLQGADTVASMVVFENGKPKKSDYRKFIIKSIKDKPDDFTSMAEVVERHYRRILEEGKSLPDLIMIDGGKGQLNAAIKSLKKLNLTNYNIIGLAKRLEEIFLPYKSESILISKTSSSLKLLQKIRDEAHRFAITFHREKRTKRVIKTDLEDIPGIGDKLSKKLLTYFGSIERLKAASLEEISNVIGKKKAQVILDWIQSN